MDSRVSRDVHRSHVATRRVAESATSQGFRQRARGRATTLIVYLDTSAFVKLFIEEPGSETVSRAWTAAESRASSRLLYPEARAALASAGRGGRIGTAVVAHSRRLLERLWEEVERIDLTGPLAHRAGDLVTFDRNLRRAARTAGFPVAPRSV